MRLAQERDEGENEGYNVTQCGTLLREIESGCDREFFLEFATLPPIDFLRDRKRQACRKKLAPIFHEISNEMEKKIFEREFIRTSHKRKLPFRLLTLS